MKGHKENCQRRNGGSTKMRDMGGFKAPRMGENEHVMKEAKGKTTGIVKMDGPDGDVAKKRLDRPGRKHGGHVKHKADGGFLSGGDGRDANQQRPMTDADRAAMSDMANAMGNYMARRQNVAPSMGRKHGGAAKEHHAKHHEKHKHEEHHKHGGHVKKKMMADH